MTIEGRTVFLRAWKYDVAGPGEFHVPVYFLDADLPENSEWDRTLTHYLYGGDQHYRLCQEIILGIGGVRMLRAMGLNEIERFHMNEGHSAYSPSSSWTRSGACRQAGTHRDDIER